MPSNRLEIDDIPELPGYMTVAAVAEKYGMHKGTVYYMIFKSKRFKTVFKVTRGGNDKNGKSADQRPLLLLSEREVETVMAQKAEDAAVSTHGNAELRARLAEWNRRVKTWGRNTGWTETPIAISGPPQVQLVEAYVKDNQHDPKPRMSEVAAS